jgi:hypothetical protein
MNSMRESEKSHGESSTRMGTVPMRSVRAAGSTFVLLLVLATVVLAPFGCYNPPVDVSQTPAPLRFRLRKGDELSGRYEDEVTGGELFTMYCGYCHNMRAMGERPFSNYQNVVAHMRVRAQLTGEEQAKIEAFFRRWHDIPPASGPVEASPKRQIFSQPVAELREESQAQDKAAASARAALDQLMPAPATAPPPAARTPGVGGGLPPAIP